LGAVVGWSCASGTSLILREDVAPAITRIGDRTQDGSTDLRDDIANAGQEKRCACTRHGRRAIAGAASRASVARATTRSRRGAHERHPATRVVVSVSSRLHFTNREEETKNLGMDNPRTMKTTEIHDDGASTRRTGWLRRSFGRLRARIGSEDAQRGAVAVEFAIIAPVLVVLTFGVIEFSSAYHDKSAAADAARAGARAGSAMATQSGFAAATASAVSAAVSTLPASEPQELWIYKANSQGYPGSGSSFSSCGSNCIKYSYSPASRTFVPSGGGGWSASTQQACTQPFDEIGVYVKLNHTFVTKLFGTSVTLTDHAVFRFEPVASSQCS
jgi:hypothetical protein